MSKKLIGNSIEIDDSSQSEGKLEFDGIYRSYNPKGGYTYYLRFYPDGLVLALSSTKTPEQVISEFNRDSVKNSIYQTRGYYNLQNNIIKFLSIGFYERRPPSPFSTAATKNEMNIVVVEYVGEVHKNALVLTSYSYKTKYLDEKREYKFFKFP
ncbi:MAG: hypothetical protein ACFFDI_31410 [Promethearchaeota archaeon]